MNANFQIQNLKAAINVHLEGKKVIVREKFRTKYEAEREFKKIKRWFLKSKILD